MQMEVGMTGIRGAVELRQPLSQRLPKIGMVAVIWSARSIIIAPASRSMPLGGRSQ